MTSSINLPLVSVIIPTYNRSNLLRLTIESVLSQTYPNVEIIVVDDASTDDTPVVMKSYSDRVRYIREPINRGGDTTCFSGLKVANGVYVNFLDHDDLFLPRKLERQVRLMEQKPELGLVHCGYYHIDQEGALLEKISFLPEGQVFKQLLRGDFVWSGGPLFRRSCMDQAGLIDEFWSSGDWSRVLKIAQAGYPFGCIQEPLGAYRILPDSEVSNVAGLEEWVLQTLDKIFASPDLSADVVAVEAEAYARIHLYLGCRYYSASQWENGSSSLEKALDWQPEWRNRPEFLSRFFFEDALNVRVNAPIDFIEGVLEHLPESMLLLKSYREYILARVYSGLSMRSYACHDVVEAKGFLVEAVRLDPHLLESMDDFIEILCKYAMSLPTTDPVQYVRGYLEHLPVEAQAFSERQRKVIGQIRILSAFQSYYAGQFSKVPAEVLKVLIDQPVFLANRGVVSILIKSLLKWAQKPKDEVAIANSFGK